MEGEPHVLVVDDDRDIRELLSRYLRKNGMRVDVAANGHDMEARLTESKIDLVILDRVMPGEDGLTLCRELRARSRVPIIMLTLLGADTDRILGLEMGADDYLQKPFNPQELLARIRAILRRTSELPLQSAYENAGELHFAGWTLDRTRHRLIDPSGAKVSLTDGEYDLMVAFAEHPQMVLSRDQLLDLARGRSAIAFDRSIDMQIARLRRKIEVDPAEPEFIKTVRNKGYVFTPEVVGKSHEADFR